MHDPLNGELGRLVALAPPEYGRINALVRQTCAKTLSLPALPAEVDVDGPVDEAESVAVEFAESLKRARRGRTTVLAVTALRQVDADFLELPRQRLADAALSAAVAAGASHADLRVHRIVNEVVQLRDGELETAVVDREVGLAVRVIVDGTWGFASHAELDTDVAAETARRAVQVARALAPLNAETIELAPEPVYSDVSWVSTYRIDPFAIPAADKIGLLEEYSGRLLAADGVDHVSASLHAVKEQTFYADTLGSSITQQRVRVQPTAGGGHRRRRGRNF